MNPRKRCYIIYSESKNQFRVRVQARVFHVKPQSDLFRSTRMIKPKKSESPVISKSTQLIRFKSSIAFLGCHAYVRPHMESASVMTDKSKLHLHYRINPCSIQFIHFFVQCVYKRGVFFIFLFFFILSSVTCLSCIINFFNPSTYDRLQRLIDVDN